MDLAPIASSLLHAVECRSDLDLNAVGESVALLARLLVSKSADLIAQPDEDDELTDLAQAEVDPQTSSILARARALSARQGAEAFPGVSLFHEIERPVAPRSAGGLVRALQGLNREAQRSDAQVSVPAFVRLETALSHLVSRLKARAPESVGRLLAGKSRNDAVVHFLALLELVRTGRAAAHQEGPLQDIRVEWAVEAGRREARAG